MPFPGGCREICKAIIILDCGVALNNFGKSNVLSGIAFGLAFIKAPVDEKMNMMSNVRI